MQRPARAGKGEMVFSGPELAFAFFTAFVILSVYGIVKTMSMQGLSLTPEKDKKDKKGGKDEKEEEEKKGVCLLIAHPDDETMFFVPTILALRRDKIDVRVLCMSNGSHDGLGKVREKELLKACAKLGVQEDHVTIVDDKRLQDGPNNNWEVSAISEHLLPFIDKHNIGALVTFDNYGISGHPNHIALHTAVAELRENKALDPAKVRVHRLQSVALFRKFSGPMCYLERRFLFVGLGKKTQTVFALDVALVYGCLWAHKSQAVWYRSLFVLFSRYTYMNVLKEF